MTSLLDNSDVDVTDTVTKFEDLVGEGKKFKDNDAVVNKIAHSDAHIARLEREQALMREDLHKALAKVEANDRLASIEDLLKRPREAVSPSNDGNQPREPDRTAPLDETRIEEILARRELASRKEDNLKAVKKALVAKFGRDYVSQVEQVATNLEVGVAFLEGVAAENPAAFFKLVGMDGVRPQVDNVTPPRGVQTQFQPDTSGQKNYKYYDNMRRSDPKRFHTTSTQWEMDQMAIKFAKEGKDFFA